MTTPVNVVMSFEACDASAAEAQTAPARAHSTVRWAGIEDVLVSAAIREEVWEFSGEERKAALARVQVDLEAAIVPETMPFTSDKVLARLKKLCDGAMTATPSLYQPQRPTGNAWDEMCPVQQLARHFYDAARGRDAVREADRAARDRLNSAGEQLRRSIMAGRSTVPVTRSDVSSALPTLSDVSMTSAATATGMGKRMRSGGADLSAADLALVRRASNLLIEPLGPLALDGFEGEPNATDDDLREWIGDISNRELIKVAKMVNVFFTSRLQLPDTRAVDGRSTPEVFDEHVVLLGENTPSGGRYAWERAPGVDELLERGDPQEREECRTVLHLFDLLASYAAAAGSGGGGTPAPKSRRTSKAQAFGASLVEREQVVAGWQRANEAERQRGLTERHEATLRQKDRSDERLAAVMRQQQEANAASQQAVLEAMSKQQAAQLDVFREILSVVQKLGGGATRD